MVETAGTAMRGELANDPGPGGGARADTRLARTARWLALLGFPASLTSPGATVSFALVGVYGLYLLANRRDMPHDLRLVNRAMLAGYFLLLAVDVLNGGGWSNLTATAVNYLPLVALAPYAYALRSLRLVPDTLDRAMQATIVFAVLLSAGQFGLFSEARPGGPNLNPIPYGFVIAVWAMFLLARGLETGRASSLALVPAALVPVFLTGSKIALVCMLVGLLCVAILWVVRHRRWYLFLAGLAGAGFALVLGYYLILGARIREFLNDLNFLFNGEQLVTRSLGDRVELARAGWQAFLERPFLGHGQAQYMDAVRAWSRPGGLDLSEFGHLHNDYLVHMVSFGVFGVVFLAGYLAVIFWLVTKSGQRPYRWAGYGLLAMVVIYMAPEVAFNMDPITGCLTLAFGAVLSAARCETAAPEVKN